MWSFAARKPLTCFYCLTPTSPRQTAGLNPYYWKCPACEQWNRRNTRGEIVPDPGAQNVFTNHGSWQKRASLPDNAFPPGTPWSPFCTQCVTNQKLIVEMVANYIPDESDPNYLAALANVSAYRADLERRYPPLCEECRPRVEEELRKHNNEATAEIRASMAAATFASPSSTPRHDVRRETRELRRGELRLWRVRGLIWVLGLVLSVARCIRVLVHPSEIPQGDSATREVIITLASILWTTWNPKWLRYRRYLQAGVLTQTTGLRTWTIFQLIIYVFRVLLSLSYLGIFNPILPDTQESYRILGALSLTADTLFSFIAYRTITIKKIPLASKRTLAPLGPAPPRQTFYENALDGLRLSDSPQHTPTKQRLTSAPRARTISPRFPSSLPNGDLRSSSAPPPAPPSGFSPTRIPATPPLAGSSVTTEDDPSPMDLDPPPYETHMKPQTFPPRFSATGLEDLLSSWNLSDTAPPPPRRREIGGGWQEVGLLELLEGVALCVGWASGEMRAMQVGWACIGVVGIYKLGQRQTLAAAVAASAALMRAALPLPLLASRLGVSAMVEALLWDIVCLAIIGTARLPSRS
ncbi:hypothetical protein CALVIDRAFT_543389 [Calocera viscosa TUFC12733]|uniref:Ima1 N-terminal domain-containing protein n=1 Tax=Calocera viscosa (strain TUFC12733) TaxID=1330018 RepID=A0A167FMK8_CALVF|nr:hypothetical protein CALVIDRAFT_543389 [Calocera viscosa TUFC12733]